MLVAVFDHTHDHLGRPPSYVLLQSCHGWWDQLHVVIFCGEFLPGFVNVIARHGSVVEQYVEPLDGIMPSSGMPLGAEYSFSSASESSGKIVQFVQAMFL